MRQYLRNLTLSLLLATGASITQAATPATAPASAHRFEVGPETFLLDGKPYLIRCGELHAARIPREYWRHRLQMARALGLNAVCAYLFWNQHEPREGVFDFSGQADIAEFCRLAQAEGLWVVLRPGPYACAEWEMGGLPWWLLKHDDIRLRSRDPRFLAAAHRYLAEVGRVLAPLQVTRGGPILLVQAENEYGFFGKDAAYMGEIRQALLDAGFDVPLFSCNPTYALRNGFRDDLLPVVNFGSDPKGAFEALRKVHPKGPLMSGEFYPGWFDTWGQPHHRGNTERYLKDLETMLHLGASFSIYMAHGGTSFGFSSGADRPFKPDTTSYDYDAPISEAGWTTPKFAQTRALFAKHLQPGETIPEPPAANPLTSFGPLRPVGFAPLLGALPTPVHAEQPLNFEKLDVPHGLVLYRATVPAGPEADLKTDAVHDFAQVFLDGKRVGLLERRSRRVVARLPAREKPAVLELLVEAMGRVNFGQEVHDRKGLRGPVLLGGTPVLGWDMFALPLDAAQLAGLKFSGEGSATNAGFHRFTVTLDKPADTFLDLSTWTKGVVWVNGHNLGRFWDIGPQQTLYVPGPWLRAGENEIVVLDLLGPREPVLSAVRTPVLDQLRPELDVFGNREPLRRVRVAAEPAIAGEFPKGSEAQRVQFAQARTGRYFMLESLSAQGGNTSAAIADVSLLGEDGSPLSSQAWTIAGGSSEENVAEAAGASNAIDGQVSNFWHSEWKQDKPSHPHWLVIDLGKEERVSGFIYVPRQGTEQDAAGRIKGYRAYVGNGITEDKR